MIIEQVKKTIRRHNLISKNDRILIGVSGGADSVTLLYILNSLKNEFNLTLFVAHLDHCLRKDSASEARFVQRLAQKLGIPVCINSVNVRRLAKKGSLEEAARNARLDFLFKVAKRVKAKKIALGHNLDDQAETVLMRILRGTGLYGLAGIVPKRNIKGLQIIRPLLEVSRKEIEGFLSRRKITPRIDLSNLQDLYFRNKIRNKLLPLLEKEYSRNIKALLVNLAESAGYDYDYLYGIASKRANKGVKRFALKDITRLHPAIQRLIFRYTITKIKGDTRSITFQHIREIEDLLSNRPVNSIVDLPKSISVIKKKKYLSFYLR